MVRTKIARSGLEQERGEVQTAREMGDDIGDADAEIAQKDQALKLLDSFARKTTGFFEGGVTMEPKEALLASLRQSSSSQ